MSGNEMNYIQEAFDTNWVVPLGPNVNGFESDLKEWLQKVECADDSASKSIPDFEVVALASGTAAIHLALVDIGVGPGDEVICQSFTFCASSNPVCYQGATPVFVDSEPDTWNMDPELLEKAINDRIKRTGKKPKAIIIVHLYGMPARIDRIMEIARRYDIPVIEDAAEGFGSRFRGQATGTFGDYGILSFNGNKMITTSGGGALVVKDNDTKQRVMFFATQAREAFPYYQHEHIGFNYRMSNICAGIGRGQMTILDEHIRHHHRIAEIYAEAFSHIDGITYHANPEPHIDSNYWLSTIVLDEKLRVKGQEDAYRESITGAVGGAAGVVHSTGAVHTECEPNPNVEAMRLQLLENNIESRPLWKPMHLQPVYAKAPSYDNGVSRHFFERGLCLPSGPMVTEDDARRVIETIKHNIL